MDSGLPPLVRKLRILVEPLPIYGKIDFFEGIFEHGIYPEVVLGDPVYGTRGNRKYLKSHGIRFAGKPLGRPKKVTDANKEEPKRLKAQRREDYLQRIPIEGKFGQGKNGYNLNYIRAKRADTSQAWINSIFLVMHLLILLRTFWCCVKGALWRLCCLYCHPGEHCSVRGIPDLELIARPRDYRRSRANLMSRL